MNRIYFDHNATMPAAPEVLEFLAKLPRDLGNPASPHEEGRRARAVLESARASVAEWAGVAVDAVVFTSGGTEANALAVHAMLDKARRARGHARIALQAGSHPSMREAAESIPGWKIERFLPGSTANPDETPLEARSIPDASVVLALGAHNETGEIYPLARVIDEAHGADSWLAVDAVQIPGKISAPPEFLHYDAFTISGHKFGGIMGAGALIIPSPTEIEPLFRGGGQEFGRRGGTPGLHAIAALGRAISIKRNPDRARALAIRLRDELKKELDAWQVELSSAEIGLPGTLLVSFPEVPGDLFAAAIDRAGVAVSFGSACSSGAQEPSKALIEMEVPAEFARSAIRFSLSDCNTDDEIARAVPLIASAFRAVRDALAKKKYEKI